MSKLNKYFLVVLFLLPFFIHPTIVSASVLINEILPHPSTGDDWIELYKTDSNEVDISGWKLEDSTSVMKTFSDGTKIASSASFLQVFLSNRLNNGGDTVRLKDKNDNVIDEKSYNSDPGTDVSLGRYPDGSSNWGILTSSTPNASNSNIVPTSTPIPTLTPVPTSVPSDTPTPTSSSNSPSATPTSKSATSVPTKKPTTVAPVVYGDDYDPNAKVSPARNVLGESISVTVEPSVTVSEQKGKDNKISLGLLFILIVGGITCIGSAVFLSMKEVKKREKIFF